MSGSPASGRNGAGRILLHGHYRVHLPVTSVLPNAELSQVHRVQ
jgi:hypothetical protein